MPTPAPPIGVVAPVVTGSSMPVKGNVVAAVSIVPSDWKVKVPTKPLAGVVINAPSTAAYTSQVGAVAAGGTGPVFTKNVCITCELPRLSNTVTDDALLYVVG